MTESDSGIVLKDLADLLEEERRALIRGDASALAELIPRKTDLVERFQNLGSVSQQALEPLRLHAARNQNLMNSAMAGLRDVADRLGAMRVAGRATETYTAEGRRSSLRAPGGSVEKRA